MGNSENSLPTIEFIRRLPKVELHAHLSGSVSVETLIELDTSGQLTDAAIAELKRIPESTADCFSYFSAIGRVIVNLERLRLCTLSVLKDFAAENTIYLELRSTPKQFLMDDGTKTSTEDYVRVVRETVAEFQATQQNNSMTVRLLLTLDRARVTSVDDCVQKINEIRRLAQLEENRDFVVGIDIAGDPSSIGALENIVIPAFINHFTQEERDELSITMHTAEDVRQAATETGFIIAEIKRLNIRRLGHCIYLPDEQRESLMQGPEISKDFNICVELCPTSNKVCGSMKADLSDHHFPKWYNNARKNGQDGRVGVSVCTDDRGLFRCSLSSELELVTKAFGLTNTDLVSLQSDAMKGSFLGARKSTNSNEDLRLKSELCKKILDFGELADCLP